MYLKSIEMQGFKSFIDKTELQFENGITTVVGPNGSGKSNIADAVRWVLGEQSAKTLRGAKMEDVIFAGTQKRAPVGFASVTLTIDNSDRALPIEFNEVSVSRRVYRSGESEYMINNAPCRLKDIHELFMDTGLGRDGYSIISQGRIDDILSSKSEDRRQVFEEAAGISKYRYRRDEARRKLQLTEDNLVRITDIITELENQLEPLRLQSEKTKKYLILREEQKSLEVSLWLSIIENGKSEIEKIENKYQTVKNQIDELKKQADQSERETAQLYQDIKDIDEKTENMRNGISELEGSFNTLTNDICVMENTVENNKTMIERIDEELSEINEEIRELEKRQETLNAQITYYTNVSETVQTELAGFENELKEIASKEESQSSDMQAIKSDVMDKLSKVSDLKIRLGSAETIKNNFTDRQEVILAQVNNKNENRIRIGHEKQKISDEYEKTAAKLKAEEDRLSRFKLQSSETAKQIEEHTKKENSLILLLNDKQSKLKLFRDMETSYDGYAYSVKEVMNEASRGALRALKIYGTVSKLLSVPGEYTVAIEVAAGNALQNIVVETEEDAKQAIAYLKKEAKGRATFLPVSSVSASELSDNEFKGYPGYIGIASRLISFDDKYTGIVKSLFGRLLVVDNIDNAVMISKKLSYKYRVVTKDGDIINAGGAMTGGSVNKNARFLSKKTEITKLEEECAGLKSEMEKIKDEIYSLTLTKKQFDEEIIVAEEKADAARLRINTLEAEQKHQEILLHNEQKSLALLESELDELSAALISTEEEMQKISEMIETNSKEIESAHSSISKLETQSVGVLSKKQELAAKISELSTKRAITDKDIESCKDRLKSAAALLSENLESKLKYENEKENLLKSNTEIVIEIENKKERIKKNKAEIEESKALISEYTQNRAKMEQKIRSFGDENKLVAETMYRLQQEQGRIESKKFKAELELENTINKLWEDYELTFTTAQPYRIVIENASRANKRVSELKASIKELGNINIDAVEEYRSVKERYEFLSGQKQDLEDAKENILKIITDMTEIMKKQFKEQFAVINEEFNAAFQELFGGGRAELRLSDPNDILGSGIEIDVQPPGKKLQSLTLLSGGERAFSAIGILFAIQKVRPAPFCIFDEIEAALDDVNVYRFADYIKKYKAETQFILITHRRGTMEAADIIYGVTMHEQGVSKILRLDMAEVPQ